MNGKISFQSNDGTVTEKQVEFIRTLVQQEISRHQLTEQVSWSDDEDKISNSELLRVRFVKMPGMAKASVYRLYKGVKFSASPDALTGLRGKSALEMANKLAADYLRWLQNLDIQCLSVKGASFVIDRLKQNEMYTVFLVSGRDVDTDEKFNQYINGL